VGSTFQLLADPIGFGKRMRAKYGDIHRTRTFGRRQVTLIGPEANELVLFDRDKIFSSEQGWGPLLNLLFPRGLMLMDFAAHRADRRALSIAFKPEPMRHYCDALNVDIARGVEAWGRGRASSIPRSRRSRWKRRRRASSACRWDRRRTGSTRLSSTWCRPRSRRFAGRCRSPRWGAGYAGRQLMVEYFTGLLRERRANPGQDMFSQFAMARRDDDPAAELLPEDVVVDHMIFLMMAAHDTITSSFTTPDLAHRQEPRVAGEAARRGAGGGRG
jgi:cytochrome P450